MTDLGKDDLSPKSKSKNATTPKLSKRAQLIAEKLKSKPKTSTSLFDSDGDLSKHNIIEGRRNRKRTTSSFDESTQPSKKKAKEQKEQQKSGPKLIKNAKQKLTPEPPRTPLDKLKNEAIQSRLDEMTSIKDRHDGHVKELYHLELFQNMLDYNPKAFIHDVRYNKYVQDHDVWEYLKTNHTLKDPSFIDLISSVMIQESASNNNIPHSSASNSIAAVPKTAVIHSGTGLRRHNRQFATLQDYLNSFFASNETTEDITPEQRDAYIEKERAILQRLYQLEQRGGFTTQLQLIANRRPQQPQVKREFTHQETLIAHMQTASKLFHVNNKYKRNAARKCAKAIERYWENIRTHDERIQREEEKRIKRLARWTSQQVKKKWKIVERVCEARHKEVLKEQQAKEGRRHLELILEHSEQMLNVRQKELRQDGTTPSASVSVKCEQEEEDEDMWQEDEMQQEDVRDHIIEDLEEESDDEELKELEQDQNLSVEELIKKYHQMQQQQEVSATDTTDVNDNGGEGDTTSIASSSKLEDDAEFSLAASDDQDIPIEEDGESEDDDVELNALNEEADLSVEELLQKYKYLDQAEEEADDEGEGTSVMEVDVKSELEDLMDIDSPSVTEDKENVFSLFTDYVSTPSEEDQEEEEADTTTQSLVSSPTSKKIQPTGNTLSTTKVYTKIPFLLRGILREYQHVGLDWLASLYNNGLNGILADEMGLGKTIQTIALLAYLACEKEVWGPHLIVVPTSVILNWEMEFKKWLPGFKIMTYYGSPKERKEKRMGWSKDNAFHVCITSYQLVLQDQTAFRRKQWQYLILDEAHHIKNFRSQRWQVLLNFNSKRRLLLTGTPLQNNLMELWSLLYFLMPNGVSQDMPIGFANLKEFQEWFSHPVDRMIESNNASHHDQESRAAIQKLHTVLRPYLLRRLKADVEKQMPEKHEHIVYCKLSKRQRYLYDDFMGRGKTKETLASGNFLSIINCLMQLRKVCNHPDLFEERPILTSFAMHDQVYYVGETLEHLVRKKWNHNKDLFKMVDFGFLNLVLMDNDHNKMTRCVAEDTIRLEATKEILNTIVKHQKKVTLAESRGVVTSRDYHDLKKFAKYREMQMHLAAVDKWQTINYVNHFRCAKRPLYDANLIRLCSNSMPYMFAHQPRQYLENCESLYHAVTSYKDRIDQNLDLLNQVGFVTPKVVVLHDSNSNSVVIPEQVEQQLVQATSVENDIFHPIQSRLSIAFPDKRLLQYDCGKLQKLDALLRELAAGGHRALIFTQMTRVLDVLETFLNMHGHRYLRLDGATKVEQRQVLTEHFNHDKRILCFILSTRSGGLGINLTGADTVIFYDSDWNPSMDKQCQDRAHRIGQTRDVHIYRFVTQFTIEENIFKKANQKRMLDNVIIQQGDFTDDYFHKNEWWKDLPEVVGQGGASLGKNDFSEQALLEAEGDENDAAAAIQARKEMAMDDDEFEDSSSVTPRRQASETPSSTSNTRPSTPVIKKSSTPAPAPAPTSSMRSESEEQQQQPTTENEEEEAEEEQEEEDEDQDMQLNVGHVDQYMLQFWEREVIGVNLGFGGFE